MSIVKKAAKTSLVLFSTLVLLFVALSIYLYVNMGGIAKDLSEQAASDALGVAVTIGDMDISLEKKTIEVTDIVIANVAGYQKAEAIKVGKVIIAADSLSKERLIFSLVEVSNTNVNLEVSQTGSNLGDLRLKIQKIQEERAKFGEPSGGYYDPSKDIKVIIRNFAMKKTQLNPSVTLLNKDLAVITAPDVSASGIGEAEGGLPAEEAIAQIMAAVLKELNTSANAAGFLEGLPLETLNEMGVDTLDVFNKNLKKSYNKEVQKFKKGFEDIKSLFE